MTESREVMVMRGPSAQSGRGLDNAAWGQRGHVRSTWGEPALTRAGARGSRSRRVRSRLLARSPGPGDRPITLGDVCML
jgi:hypothetical protein